MSKIQAEIQAGAPQPVYLDCSATTPLEPAVVEEIRFYLEDEYGNAGSRTHEFGMRAKRRVQRAREQVGRIAGVEPDEVVFTSGATEANNLAILGLRAWAETEGRRHFVTTAIEHKAVLEPMQALEQGGFDISYVGISSDGRVSVDDIMAAIRPETALVSVMHVNNETGIVQPLAELVQRMADHDAFLHVDAAQSFGKLADGALNDPRVDLISLSAHKLFGPKGVGALIARRRRYHRPPLRPLMHGGGQEAGLRPGTQPVALIAGLGTAAELAERDRDRRDASVRAFRDRALSSLGTLGAVVNGDRDHSVPHIVNASIPGVDAEALMLALKPLAAFSNGSACTSHSYTSSHVLTAMGLSEERVAGAIRLSWSHLTPEPDWPAIVAVAGRLRPQAPVVTS
jgi:cysteine desulfurase